jgi:hypothetical protein
MPEPGSPSWWTAKVRQARAFGRASVSPAERATLTAWLTPAQLQLFASMLVADQRHGLDVAAWLRADGETRPEVLLAALLHDAGKGHAGFWPRVVYSLSQAYGSWIARLGATLPGIGSHLPRLVAHAATSAELAATAGCPPLTVELIRHQDHAPADETARRFHLADEAN